MILKKVLNLNFTDRFLKCGNYCKPRFYEQILKLQELIRLENSFSFTRTKLTLNRI
ncbi:hypothetical protein LEP1GSC074_1813 [Leptospira noguchii str. Hook]|uniref:Uncharacterized protein n=1 Tax=Leptospira noguchii serovar Autumnalis str. ZUN142 TaxID=1085540 RepID=M6U166_9LEPT|nr:hypothetical protein LEP1GSC041_4548 [Leptospira noguchii str. 2006001870]EMO38772.1 hypothetical protein LEP1GSC186_2749 [Leptospira noguchii serovar Autumnalis str. ZUN142]EMS82341.1 hypothetical protein LEP1GSC074_1813 [Leptospira noguchii str. Hook]